MKKKHHPINSVATILIILLVLNLLMMIIKPTDVVAEGLNFINSNEYLYNKSYEFEIGQMPIDAIMYLFAYIQRDPPKYLNNSEGHRDNISAALVNLYNQLHASRVYEVQVRSNLRQCGCYPCNVCQLQPGKTGATFIEVTPSPVLQFPSDAAMVCTKPNYQGICRILSVGDYNSYTLMNVPNDDISSVKVGSRVKLTLYLHSLAHPQYVTFLTNDPDLSNNPISGTNYFWDNNVSSARVQFR